MGTRRRISGLLALTPFVLVACANQPAPRPSPKPNDASVQLEIQAEPAFDYDEGPTIVPGRHPLYPPSFVRSGRKAWAYIEYTVTAEGEFESVRVIQTSDRKFSGHIAAVLRRSKFQPATKAGRPVRGTVRARFTLE